MSKLWEICCLVCQYRWDHFLDDNEAMPVCPKCGSGSTVRAPGGVKNKDKAKAPYDYL